MKELFLKRYFRPRHLFFYSAALVIAFGLKYHYSHAEADDLAWILAPTAGLVEMILPMDFEFEKSLGFVCHDQSITIAPVCAGVNFLVISFCMIAFYGIYRMRHKTEMFAWLFFSFTGAFVLTLAANTLRIILSIYLYKSGLNMGWFTPSRIHLIVGIFIYVSFLYGSYCALQWFVPIYQLNPEKQNAGQDGIYLKKTFKKQAAKRLIPFIWYLMVTLGVPFLNGGLLKNKSLFLEHAVTVASLCAFIYLGFFCIRLFYSQLKAKITFHKILKSIPENQGKGKRALQPASLCPVACKIKNP
ncbi:exosortase K [Thermodesulfobacteriota bacterium]